MNELRKIQKAIANKAIIKDKFKKIKLIAGFDVAYKNNKAVCAGIILNNNMKTIEIKIIKEDVSFPYVPTFLSFRESPIIINTYKKLENKPDILLIDGNGILHPLRVGLATHVGVMLDKPTIGIAKKLLLGKCKKPNRIGKGEKIIVDSETLGYTLLTKKKCNPIYISPGHRVSLHMSLKIIKSMIKTHKLPEPLKLAHLYANTKAFQN